MSEPNPKVDGYYRKSTQWRAELEELRAIILGCKLTETMKWGCPCYTQDDRNIVLLHEFKEYCAILFFKGALLKDPKQVLIQQTKNTQSARQMRFTSAKEIAPLKSTIKAFVRAAIEVEKAGLKVDFKETAEFEMPAEFQSALKKNAKLKKAFASLTPGRQRAYLLHFAGAKQAKTRESRIEKCTPQILAGKGLND
ncbi:YdeI/OmpD-associated family protein [Blastopirellula sp. JC732]|uniref:YdeI/OmpD-associated family protein n=1 Tax=Blastopirellula sediminis TaxID=2894196 RepID=A0A9X1MK32_9BACT|nr:DUF1801 domain-containing protein [Blastopirellula sediminis]MCC9609471.1 YdeI/OmpD-associated family protein [Blastopirellula sediminis]MCC9627752.1 YdeI/OmpD-associated family protein [Blastopirellula sediminis]